MLKETVGVAGGALLLPALGVPIVACGLPGLLVAGAGVFIANAVMKDIKAGKLQPGGRPVDAGDVQHVEIISRPGKQE
jgi:hypothetical protein